MRQAFVPANSLTVTLEADAVVPLPCSTSAGPELVCCMALVSQTPVLLACAGQATQLTVLVHWVHNPVDACILQVDTSVWIPAKCDYRRGDSMVRVSYRVPAP